MLYKEYGQTGCRVSALGFGGMRFSEENVAKGNLEACASVARYAWEKGVNYFDTAPAYCNDQSECIMGMALKGLPRESFYVSSKTNFGQVDNPATEAGFMKRLETSLRRLNVEYIDFYHLWCMLSLKSYRRQCDTMYGWFAKAKEQGLIRHIAFSSHMPGEELKPVIGEGLFEGMLAGYNALNYRYRMGGIAAAYAAGMGVAVMNPLAGGVIPANPEKFAYLAEGTAFTPAQAALRFVAGHREVAVTLNGLTTRAQVDEAVSAMDHLPIRSLEEQTSALALAPNSDEICTGCGYCAGCPEDIPIPKYMDAYNHKLLGESAYGRLRWHWAIMPEDAGKCVRCGRCEGLCTQHLPIMDRLAELASLKK